MNTWFRLIAYGLIVGSVTFATSASAESAITTHRASARDRDAPSVLRFEGIHIQPLGWETVAEVPKTIRLKAGERLVGVEYYAVNRGDEPSVLRGTRLRLETQENSKGHRPSSMSTALLSPGAMGADLLPGEPHRATIYYKLPEAETISGWLRPMRRADPQRVALRAKAGIQPPAAELSKAARWKPVDGNTAEADEWKIVVGKAKAIDRIHDQDPPRGTRGVSVPAQFTNVGSESRKITITSAARIKTRDGRVYGFQGDPTIDLKEQALDVLAGRGRGYTYEVAPGGEQSSQLGFFLPKEATELWLIVDPVGGKRGKAVFRITLSK